MKLSVVIPAYNEEGEIEKTVRNLYIQLKHYRIPHEIIVVNDNSHDGTETNPEVPEKEYPHIPVRQ